MNDACFGPDINKSNIAGDATVSGSSYLTGGRTRVGAGARVHNSRLHDVVVEAGAVVVDSIVLAEGKPGSHKCDAAGNVVVRGAELPTIGARANVTGCTLTNTSVGADSVMTDTWAGDCQFGDRCRIRDAKIIITNTDADVVVTGPTEISEAWLGHHTIIDRRGYYEGVFSNKFRQLRFISDSRVGDPAAEDKCSRVSDPAAEDKGSRVSDPAAAAGQRPAAHLEVVGTIDLPHVSRYGVNTINSTNSGKLHTQKDGLVEGFGRPGGLWGGKWNLSHEQIELAPCCFVVPWTKVVGQSPAPHKSDDELVNDELMTCLMPFAMAGHEGDLTRGMVMPGELSVGLGPKQRKGGWVFTYAVDAVIQMVARLHEALEPARKHVADTIVVEALRTAIAMTQAMAHKHKVDLSIPASQQPFGWPRWIGQTHALLQAHLQGGLWEFKDGKPVGWRREGSKWTHPNIAALLAVAPDAIESQKSMEDLYTFEDPVPAWEVAIRRGNIQTTNGAPLIDPAANVAPDAFVGPGCRIGLGSVIESGASVWNAVVDMATIGRGCRVENSIVSASTVGEGTLVRSSDIHRSAVGGNSQALCARIADSQLADRTQATAFAYVRDCQCSHGTILGGRFHDTRIDCYLMSMHMAGGCSHMQALPVEVTVGEQTFSVPAIPMIGGGSLIRGTQQKPVVMQCSFIGSNAILEPGSFVGLGCFVLGTLGPDAGLLPFTVSADADPKRHQIGAVLTAMPSTIITHFIPWTFNACGPDLAPGVANLCRQGILDGIAAIEHEQERRTQDAEPEEVVSARLRQTLLAALRRVHPQASDIEVLLDPATGNSGATVDGQPLSIRDWSATMAKAAKEMMLARINDKELARYKSLPAYSDDQLAAGLALYRKALESGAWDMVVENGELRFANVKGAWTEKNGSAIWKPATAG